MVAVSASDGRFGLWGFIATVTFEREQADPKPAPGADQIVEVTIDSDILDSNSGNVLRPGPPEFNYGPIVENFGHWTTEAHDFHRFYGRPVTEAYGGGEGIRIRVRGKAWIQATRGNLPAGLEPAYTVIAGRFEARVVDAHKVKTGKLWTTPGIVQGRTPQEGAGALIEAPSAEITEYWLEYTWWRCEEKRGGSLRFGVSYV